MPKGKRPNNKKNGKAPGRAAPAPSPSLPRRRVPKPAARASTRGGAEVEEADAEKAEQPPPRPQSSFPIVGIGASAGGLEALEQFLKHVPPRSGMAFVVVQHLDPSHKGAMVELLQRATPMPVAQVTDRQKVEPDCVYVIPPNKDMSILHGVLHLLPQKSPRGLNLPIDFFFRSLAEDQCERSIGVVLSGMGSDGTLGLRAIKEKAGCGFAQSLQSAKFSGMPRSAMEAGLVDVVAAADELPARIVAYHQHAPYVRKPDETIEDKQVSSLEKIFILLRAHTGNDFSLYKRSTIYRRIERRMGLHQIDKIANYVRFLRENPSEVEHLFKELLIGVTCFFRDPPAWDHLRDHALPAMLRARPQGGVLRAWVPGCSTGEEAYSLAMVLTEAIEKLGTAPRITLQMFATDLDREAVEKARQGTYPSNIAADVSPERLRRFFFEDEHGYRVRKEIRESVVFAPQNIIMDPPFTKLDVLACRNLLIYLSPDLQKKLIPLFHYALNPNGILFLGSAETVGAYSNLFAPADGKTRLYRKLQVPAGAAPVEFPPALAGPPPAGQEHEAEPPAAPGKPPLANLPLLADRVILQLLAPAAILTNDKGDILYISGRTGKYLEPAAGKANLNVFAMAREGLRYELSSAFASVMRDDRLVVVRAPKVQTNGASQAVDITVRKLKEPRDLRGSVLVSLVDVPALEQGPPEKAKRSAAAARTGALERELQHAREEVQTTREEMQTSQEELKSTNEELQSTNEELQSTNEELTTSKEEMQSMNEELQTVNHELQSKVDELSRSNNDMKNLLNSTDIATLFLDGELCVRRFTTQTAKLIKLIPADAGRPITDIATDLDYPELADDAREVLRTLVFKEKDVRARNGRWFSVRILPYRTVDNVIDGVVITFTDVTPSKTIEASLREQADQLRQMTDSLPALVWGCRPDGTCDAVGKRWVEYTGVPENEQMGYGWLEQVHPEERARVRDAWRGAARSGEPLVVEFRIRGKDGAFRWFRTGAAPIRDARGKVAKYYCTSTDVDDLKRSLEQRAQAAERLTSILDGIDRGFVSLDSQLRVTYVNAAAERALGQERAAVLGKGLVEALPGIGPAVEPQIRAALREGRATSFEGALAGDGASQIRIFPHPGGVSMFFTKA